LIKQQILKFSFLSVSLLTSFHFLTSSLIIFDIWIFSQYIVLISHFDSLKTTCTSLISYFLFLLLQIIMATNRADTLDPALLRPGRLDRKIEFPIPDRRQKRLVFQVITSKMNLSEEVDLEDCMK
jgi:SpoVK/Ycf46/Vps4 family AAA+-type ATPase